MTESVEHPYLSVDMAKVGQIMQKLHDHVVGQRRRVEVTRDGCADSLIMISRAELETLEQALAIFADTAEFNDMCQSLKNLLDKAGVVYSPVICGTAKAVGAFADDRV